LRHVIALVFGEKDNELVDDCIQDLRLWLKERGVKIEQGDYSNVEIAFPSLLNPTPTKKQPYIHRRPATVEEAGESIELA
jgi:hypothetical protein